MQESDQVTRLMNNLSRKNLDVESSLVSDIKYRNLKIAYQPAYYLDHYRPFFLEALVRWPGQTISPSIFIPVAEESGAIYDLNDYLLEEVCHQIGLWHKDNIRYPVSINLSSHLLYDEYYVNHMLSFLKKNIFTSRNIIFEITENSVDINDVNISLIKFLKKSGFQIAIDQYGTGYSSLSFLNNICPDIIKIDNSFIQNINRDNMSITMITTCIAVARKLSIDLVIGGVEKIDQLEWLISEGAESIQGFLLHKPQYPEYYSSYGFDVK